jgi:PAS domain S-box-containing protein
MPERREGSIPDAALVRWLNELATAGIFTTDTALTITSWNRWLVRATGRAERQVIGKPLFEVFPELRSRGMDAYYTAALRGEGIILAHRFHKHLLPIATSTGGEMPQSARIAPLLDGDTVVGTLTMIEDVTERVTSESELRRQIAELEKARQTAESALRVKDEFLATLSHELRTPLNAVMGWTRILQDGGVDAATTAHALQVIDRNVDAQARLIDDLLDISRIAAGKLRLELGPVNLVQCTVDAIDAVTPATSSKNITIERRLPDSALLISADPDRIQQVIWNLLSNAVKFTPRGGRIVVTLEHEPGTARVSVADTGKGISPDFLPHVFDRFSQANSSTNRIEGGLGLGLALARQLIEMHGGEISVHSAGLGQGATFTVTLPANIEAAPASVRAPAEYRQLTGLKVLLVEDAMDWAQLLARTLSERGAEVSIAATAEEAVSCVARQRPDVVVADIGLPGEDGYSMLHRLRADGTARRLPAIAVTAYAGEQHRLKALSAGFDAYRAKPLSPQEIVAAIAEVIDLAS